MDIKDEHIDGLLSEITANKSFEMSAEARAWNDAMDKAIRFIKAYREGKGLFQQ